MHQNLKLFFPKGAFSYCIIFLVSVLLLACERVPSNNTKPVFTISNMPTFKQNKPTVTDKLQPDNQSKKFTASQNKLFLNNSLIIDNQSNKITDAGGANTELIQTPDNSELTTLDSFDLTTIDIIVAGPTDNTFIENNLNKLNETKKDNNQINQKLASADHNRTEKQGISVKEAKDLQRFEAKPESDRKGISNTERTTSTEIASVINVPKAKQKQPEIKRIKLNAFMNYNLQKLEKIMGKPSFILRDDELRLWQYKAGECIIDFFLKLNINEYSVSFIDIRASRLGNKMDIYTCEKELTDALNS